MQRRITANVLIEASTGISSFNPDALRL